MSNNKRTESQPETHDEEHFTDKSKKEEGESNGESKGESNGSSTQEVRALIDNNQVGGIIGKAGANVKRVRDESSAFVSILKSDNRNVTERVMVLKGTPAQIQHAIHLIAELLIESANSKDNKNNSNTTTDTTAIKLLVHRSAVGAIIGKSGNVIKETQTETNARVQVSNEPLPQSTEKTVTITGTADAIKAAVTKILKQLKDNPLRSGTKVFPYVPGQSMFPGSGYGLGYPSQLPLYTQPASLSGSSSATPQQSSTQKIAIPTVCAGCVIGKGGSVIRDLRAQSGTNISIADPEPSQPNERVVTLTGTPQGIQAAVFLIRQLVEQYQPPSNYSN